MMSNCSPRLLFADCIYKLVSKYDCQHLWNLDSHADLILIGPEITCENPQFPDILNHEVHC